MPSVRELTPDLLMFRYFEKKHQIKVLYAQMEELEQEIARRNKVTEEKIRRGEIEFMEVEDIEQLTDI